MASATVDLEVNEYHEEIIRNYVRFSREQQELGLRSFRATAEEFKHRRLSDEPMMTVNEVNEFFDDFLELLEKEFEQEFTHQYRVNALLMKQFIQQAEKWFLKLTPNFDQLENRRLIDLIRDYEQQNRNKIKSSKARDINALTDPINDTKSTILLKTEIQKLQQITQQLKERLSKYEKDDDFLHHQLEENVRLLNTKEMSYTQQLQMNEQRLKEVQQALTLAESELDKKFNQTNTYLNMKKIIDQKNQQIRQLREELARNNPRPSANDDEEEDEDE